MFTCFVMTGTTSDLHSFSSFIGRGSSSQDALFDFEIIEYTSDSVEGLIQNNSGVVAQLSYPAKSYFIFSIADPDILILILSISSTQNFIKSVGKDSGNDVSG